MSFLRKLWELLLLSQTKGNLAVRNVGTPKILIKNRMTLNHRSIEFSPKT
ncbi:hypothetical protein [Leptospira alexanderi]|nr:hypothetical protein [Leptospira alexanderi]